MFERKKYKQFALVQLKNRWKVPVLMALITLGISLIFEIITRCMPNLNDDLNNGLINPYTVNMGFYLGFMLFSLVLSFISTLITYILTFANTKVYLHMSKNPEQIGFDLFINGLKDWKKAIRCGLWMSLWIIIWMLPSFGAAFILTIILSIVAIFSEQLLLLTMGTPIIIFLFTIAAMIPAMIKAYAYSMTIYLAAEYDKVGAIKALNLSKIITKNHKMDLFVLSLSFIGWILLVVVTFGIAGLWVTPYLNMTTTNAYHAILKEAVDSGKVTLEDLGLTSEDKNPFIEETKKIEQPVAAETISDETENTNNENNSDL